MFVERRKTRNELRQYLTLFYCRTFVTVLYVVVRFGQTLCRSEADE